MRLIDPSQRINVLWDNDDGTRYTEEMTIRRLLAVMSDDEVKTIDLVRCNECKFYEGVHGCMGHAPCSYWNVGGVLWNDYCSYGERREDNAE